MPIRMFAIDIDGTLVAADNRVAQPVLDAIDAAAAQNVVIALSTGRRRRTARVVADQLSPPVPMVCLGGSLVKDHADTTLQRTSFTGNDLTGVVDLARDLNETAILQLDDGGHDFLVDAAPRWNEAARRYAENHSQWCHAGEARTQRPEDVLVVSFFGDNAPMEILGRSLRAQFPELAVTLVEHQEIGETYCEVTPPGIDKWHGLTHLISHLGIDPAQVCAIGDQRNDIPMLRRAGLSYAMGNAAPEVRRAAQRVTGSNHQHGVATAIHEVLRGNP